MSDVQAHKLVVFFAFISGSGLTIAAFCALNGWWGLAALNATGAALNLFYALPVRHEGMRR